jgi:hypothetical protein
LLVHLATLGLSQFAIDNSQFAIKKLRIANCELRIEMAFGYCCGVKWKQDRWIYAIACTGDIIHTTEHEIIGTGEMQLAALEKPTFVLGDRIMLLSDDQRTKQRLILGIQLLNRSWFYYVEWMPPALEESTTLDDRLAFVPQKDLARVFH